MGINILLRIFFQNMKLSDFNRPTKKVTRSKILTLPDNEIKKQSYETRIKELEEDVNKYNKLLIEHAALEDRFNTVEQDLEQLRNDNSSTTNALEQKELAYNLINENNNDLRGIAEQIPTLQYKIEQLNKELTDISRENIEGRQAYDVCEKNLIELQKTSERLNIQVGDQETKINTQANQILELSNLNTKLSGDNVEYSKTLSLTLKNFDDLEREAQSLLNDNRAARETINTLESVKTQLNSWITNLNKDNSKKSNKSSALEDSLKDSKIVIEELGETVANLIQDKEELMELNATLLTEVRKPRYFSTSSLLNRAGLPVASQAVERKYMGLGSPTLLKFKREDVNDNEK